LAHEPWITPHERRAGDDGLLFDTPLSPEQRECATVVHESAEHLMHVINDILDFSKIEAGKLRIENVRFEMADVLEQALAIVAPAAERKALTLRAEMPRVPLPPVLGDPHRLRQVMINLLGNAVKFTERGSVTLRLSVGAMTQSSAALPVEVIDTGIGIEPEAMDRLFRAFEQADGSMSRRFGGTGLGLAITRRLVELMGGCVGIESEPGAGTPSGSSWRCRRRPPRSLSRQPSSPPPRSRSSGLIPPDRDSGQHRGHGHAPARRPPRDPPPTAWPSWTPWIDRFDLVDGLPHAGDMDGFRRRQLRAAAPSASSRQRDGRQRARRSRSAWTTSGKPLHSTPARRAAARPRRNATPRRSRGRHQTDRPRRRCLATAFSCASRIARTRCPPTRPGGDRPCATR
jgi:hypothetical protein